MAGLDDLAAGHDEPSVVRTMRDYLVTQIRRWATGAVDDTASRRQAERFLAWAERPGQLAAAQERGGVWAQVDRWLSAVDAAIGDPALAAWQAAAAGF